MFTVEFLPSVRAQIDVLDRKAGLMALSEVLTESVKLVDFQLRTRPLEWGDPLYPAPSRKAVVYRGLADGLLCGL